MTVVGKGGEGREECHHTALCHVTAQLLGQEEWLRLTSAVCSAVQCEVLLHSSGVWELHLHFYASLAVNNG